MIKRQLFLKQQIFFLYLSSHIVVLAIPFFLYDIKKALIFSVLFLIIYVILVELIFRLSFRILNRKPYQFIPKLPFKEMYIEPHPYLPYVLKRNFVIQKGMLIKSPLNQNKGYIAPQLKTNNFRHFNGPKGDRDIQVPKPKNLIRINCLGSSTTAYYISYNNKNYAYPLELEEILKDAFPKIDIEVNNCAESGFTSAEILIKFLLDIIDTGPDIIVIYEGYNDLQPSLTEGFQSDYSHSRRNLGEIYHLYEKASKIPAIPLASWNFMINRLFFSQNLRFSLLDAVTRRFPDIKNEFRGVDTFRRNIEHIINVCKARNIQVILSTFCHYLYPEVKDNETYLKYHEGIRLANEVIRELAFKYNLLLVNNDLLIPRENRYFIDTIHFSPDGMRLVAENISRPIIDYINRVSQKYRP